MLADWTNFWQGEMGALRAVLAIQAVTIIWLLFAHTRITRNQLGIAKLLKDLLQK